MTKSEKIEHPILDEITTSLDQSLKYESKLEKFFGEFLDKEMTDDLREDIIKKLYDDGLFFEILKEYLPIGVKIKNDEHLKHHYGFTRFELKKMLKGKKFTAKTLEGLVSRFGEKLFDEHTAHHPSTISDYADKEGLDKGKKLLEGLHYKIEGHTGVDLAKEPIKDLESPAMAANYTSQVLGGLYKGDKQHKRAAGN